MSDDDEKRRSPQIDRRLLPLLMLGGLCLYVLLGALERVSFSRMASAMPFGILLMHTMLAMMSLMFFSVLQLARSQSNGPPISDLLQQLHMPDVVAMAALDVLHSLLALIGATVIPGVVQAMLVYASIPAVTLFGALLAPEPATGGGDDGAGAVDGPAGKPKGQMSLRLQLLHAINHHSPLTLLRMMCCAPSLYHIIGAVLVAITAALVVVAPHAAADHVLRAAARSMRELFSSSSSASSLVLDAADIPPRPATTVGGDGVLPVAPLAPSPPVHAPLPLIDGRILFVAGALLSALSAAFKRRCLSRHPADLLVLNTCLSGVSLLAGLVLGPPLLLALYLRPIRDTLLQLARGLRCFMSGFNASICVDNRDAFGTPNVLVFFVASTAWNATAYGLLRLGGEAHLALGGALVLPVTILAFVRPVPLPYSWAAPPEPLSDEEALLAIALTGALAIYHLATLILIRRGSSIAARTSRMRLRAATGRDSARDEDSPGFVGPSLHL